jgi:hypothetical protein
MPERWLKPPTPQVLLAGQIMNNEFDLRRRRKFMQLHNYRVTGPDILGVELWL